MGSPIIDFHVHAYPGGAQIPDSMARARKSARAWIKPFTQSLHQAHTLLRHLPEPLRHGVDQVSGIAPIAGLLMESSVQDLLEAMEDNEIDQALLVAQPSLIPNEFVLEAATEDPRLLAVVNLASDTARPAAALKGYAKKGARALKIHPAADAGGSDSKRYKALLKTASELQLPVILHTGRNSRANRAELFSSWFSDYPETTFVLAHMNFHEPNVALDLALEYGNVYVDTSWQPAETIGEAVRRVGASRILFASDWPFLGNNLAVGLQRIEDCIETGLITEEDSRMILGENAARILKLENP